MKAAAGPSDGAIALLDRAVMVLALGLTACATPAPEGPGRICTTEAVAGVRVEVVNAETGRPEAEGARATASNPYHAESLELAPDGAFVGLWEQDGSYDVTVEKEGFHPWRRDDVHIEVDAAHCHVVTTRIRAELVPLAPGDGAEVTPATLSVVVGLEEEGVRERTVEDRSRPPPVSVEDGVWADARTVVSVLAPTAEVEVRRGEVHVDGRGTGVPAGEIGGAFHAPVIPLARHLGALAHPGQGGDHVTLWPEERLCEYLARGADPEAAVYRAAEEEGLFEGCRSP